MHNDVREEGVRHVAYAQTAHRDLLERSLRMRAVSYLAQQKAILLTQTIFEIDRSKDELRDHSLALEKDRDTILKQRAELEKRTAALEEIQRTLDERVQLRTQELARANAALKEEVAMRERIQTEREQLNEKYLQAQKLELVGQLSGGLAHDFNNLLTVIMGHGELAQAALAGTPVVEHLQAIVEATRRGGDLTRQLLAFARKRARSATVIEPARVVEEFAQLVHRVLGTDIALELKVEPGSGSARLTSSELEQIVLNLVMNARDAMPRGGTITLELKRIVRVETGPLPHGPCVMLSVRDTGQGMSANVKQHLFEPFFTTKPPGFGTGLGLATVQTIVQEYDGSVEVETHEGTGSTFRVYFPIVSATAQVAAPKDLTALPQGNETLLVVDDDEHVQTVIRHMLQPFGYRVFTAGSATSALELLGRERVDLMLVDPLIRDRPGEALVGEIALRWPATRVLFMSGCADRPQPRGDQDVACPCIEKPLELAPFATAVRNALDEVDERSTSSRRD